MRILGILSGGTLLLAALVVLLSLSSLMIDLIAFLSSLGIGRHFGLISVPTLSANVHFPIK
ncbi:hypothetical protein ACWOFR_08875 [Carnobacterium gallinarum]|uniref:hypothetical protein n=1 Tax=Carnobacterium gallinarum TaxID=2749 RepID=UPI000AA00640|nr:hypothetical protein [Carnobacterium gallinarum]